MSVEIVLEKQSDAEDTGVFPRRWTSEEFDQAAELGWFQGQCVELRHGRVYEKIASPFSPNRDTSVQLRRWTVKEYDQAAELGWFEGQRVELICGEVYQKVPQNPPHYSAIRATSRTMENAFGEGYDVRQQGPLVLPDDSKPEPDILVAVGTTQDYEARHPTVADTALVIEISDSTLRFDRTAKAADYAAAGIPDYWLTDINARTLAVHRDPVPMPDTPTGFGYRSVITYLETESVSPLAKPDVSIRVADLLPRPMPAP